MPTGDMLLTKLNKMVARAFGRTLRALRFGGNRGDADAKNIISIFVRPLHVNASPATLEAF